MASKRLPWAAVLLSAGLLLGCAERRHLPVRFGDRSAEEIPGIDRCDDFETAPVEVDPSQRLNVLVHGCYASSKRLATLAKVFEARGQQVVCFSYDDRESLRESAQRLRRALDRLRAHTGPEGLTVIGHSQGGLVARHAMRAGGDDALRAPGGAGSRLVTISSPFRGIEASSHCGLTALHVLTLGITVAVCKGIAGSKWRDIHPRSDFIRRPGELRPAVVDHLKVVTDERGSCRSRDEDGECVEDDFVFSLKEQYYERIDVSSRVRNVEIEQGHAAVIGMPGRPPVALLRVLAEDGVLEAPPPEGRVAFRRLLARLY